MPARRAEPVAAASRDAVSSDAQIMRAFIAVAAGLMLAFWVLRPLCADPNLRTMLPEHRVLAGIPALVI
jgi:hypothetical protein